MATIEVGYNNDHEFFHTVLALAGETLDQIIANMPVRFPNDLRNDIQLALSVMMLSPEQYPLFYNGLLNCLCHNKAEIAPQTVTFELLRCVWEHTPRLICALLSPHLDKTGALQFLAVATNDMTTTVMDELVRSVRFDESC